MTLQFSGANVLRFHAKISRLHTKLAALVPLLKLVTVDRIVQEICKVGGEQKAIIHAVKIDLGVPEMSVPGEPYPRRTTAKRRIDVALPADEAALDCPLGHLVSRVPRRVIPCEAQVPAAASGTLRVFYQTVDLSQALVEIPRAVG